MKLMRALLLFVVIGCLAQSVSAQVDCVPPFTWNYAVSYAIDSDGAYLYTSATLTGSATMAPPYCWYQQGTPRHVPGVQNQIQDLSTGAITGGWVYGPSQCVQCQVN